MIKVYHLRLDKGADRLLAEMSYNEKHLLVRCDPDDAAAVARMRKVFEDLRLGPKDGLALVEVAHLDGDKLEEAFERTNSIDCNWEDAPRRGHGHDGRLRVIGSGHRSTSVGDLMVRGDKAHLVAPIGYIEFDWPSDAEWLAEVQSRNANPVVEYDVEHLLALATQYEEDMEGDEVDALQKMLRCAVSCVARDKLQDLAFGPEVLEIGHAGFIKTRPPLPAQADSLSAWMLRSARRHGEDDDPDHEAGDLQDFLRATWKAMTHQDRRDMLAHGDFVELYEMMVDEDRGLFTDIEDVDAEDLDEALESFGLDSSFQYTDHQLLDVVNAHRMLAEIADESFHTVEARKRKAYLAQRPVNGG